MPEPSTFLLFVAAAIAMLVMPGPAVLYVVTRSVAQGRGAGLVSVLGVHAGSVVHVAFATLGVSALLYASATAFTVVKYAGAAYLVLLGVRKLLSPRGDEAVAPAAVAPRARLLGQGMVVNVLNPKTALFFLAFLPQFANPARGPIAPQLLVLGCTFIVLGLVSDASYALLAGTLAGRLRRVRRVRVALDRSSGVVFIGLGAAAALAGDARHR
jgi:threonine/homoserine/homoserine lactone efflux protein